MTFREDFYASGWANVTSPKDMDCVTAISFSAQTVARKGAVRAYILWQTMYEHDGGVCFGAPSTERHMSIGSIVTDLEARGQGLAREALRDLIRLARKWGFTHIFVEPVPMGRKFKAKMKEQALRDWYTREGFQPVPGAKKIMQLVF